MKTYSLGIILLIFFCGCAADYVEIDRTVPPYYHAQNFYSDAHGRDAFPRRILILPSWGNSTTETLRTLDAVLVQELTKANVAEIIPPLKFDSQNRRPHQEFSLEEAKLWAQKAGADGVLLCRITSCRPIYPISLGANIRIYNFTQNITAWAVDETMDAQLTPVANGARNYYLSNFRASYPNRKSEYILNSPSIFFQYAFAELFSTLPGSWSPPKGDDDMLPPMKK